MFGSETGKGLGIEVGSAMVIAGGLIVVVSTGSKGKAVAGISFTPLPVRQAVEKNISTNIQIHAALFWTFITALHKSAFSIIKYSPARFLSLIQK
jgi:hypothetical protein